jgi:tetratricopeptide (TPR) repeat protein
MKKIRRIFRFFLVVFLIFGFTYPAGAASYEGYNYSWDEKVKPGPIPYLPIEIIDGQKLNIGSFQSPEDLHITEQGEIYILDSGNNRIVHLDSDWNLIQEIKEFKNGSKMDTFRNPNGIFVESNGNIYVADTGNERVVELSSEGILIRKIEKPESEILRSNFTYRPIKISVDRVGRIYIVSQGVFDGIMEFDRDGQFTGFIGINPVQFSVSDLFWKQISTKEQRKRMNAFIPIEFNNLDVDEEGFIYVTTADDKSEEPISRLNPSGIDILKRRDHNSPKGDLEVAYTGSKKGQSTIVDVSIDKNGIYNILDAKRGRIFTYDKDGSLMYQFGEIGEKFGDAKTPVAIDTLNNDIVLLDKGLNQVTVFKPTRYGAFIRDAVVNADLGEEEKSSSAWKEVLKLNNNLEQAHIGIGKSYLRKGENYEAMMSFQQGMNQELYSKAYSRYRQSMIWDNFGILATSILVGIVLLAIGIHAIRAHLSTEPGVIRMGLYTTIHPFKGFWDLKYEKKGKQWFTVFIIALLTITYILKAKYAGFIVNPLVGEDVKAFDEFKYILISFFLWCVSNWSLTTLMNGEGKFKEIVMVTGYSLLPVLITQILLIFFSHIVTLDEMAFYHVINTIGFIWSAGLLFVGIMTIHQYTPGKTVVTILLTFVVMAIIIFLALLIFSLAQQMLVFGSTLYREISFRLMEG